MPNGLVIERFYRVLFVEPPGPHHMIDNWNAGRFIGYHIDQHPDWATIWANSQSQDCRDYPLTYSAGFYAWEARISFLASVQSNGGLTGWSPDEDRASRQILGVPAFRCPLGAIKYAENAPVEPLIATFDGTFVWYLPEEDDTGVQAIVVRPVGAPVALGAFRANFGVPAPQDEDEGEIELSYGDDD